ncbi:uncharacterized protein [Chironomus tepperi]|uniref:uncharacterized protein n=1 Tax=Chironomus tepperi TaxID=113505 RepID=UPI00391F4526
MACVACESYEKRITNVYRDEELKEKYEKLVGYQVIVDCFICDGCNQKLVDALEFQQNCIKVYKKNNQNYDQYSKSSLNQSSELGSKEQEYFILQTGDDEYTNEDLSVNQNQSIGNEFAVYEINEKEVQFEEPEQQSCSKTSEDPKNELDVQECLIIEKQSEMDDTLMTYADDQNISYLDDSKGGKKARKSYTVQQKLSMIEYAEQNSNREAARKFNLNESTIRCFRRQKETLEGMNPNKSTNRHGTPYWPELEAKLKEWADKQTSRPKMLEVKREAIKISKSLGYENFSGSNTYIFKFMQRNNIETASPRPRKKLKIEFEEDS